MKKAMISQPMAGKTEEEIVATRNKAVKALEDKGYEIVNTLFTDEWYSADKMMERGVVQIPLCFLAKSLENMSLCHAAYFCKGWKNARGCRLEHDAAVAYGVDIIYERDIRLGDKVRFNNEHRHEIMPEQFPPVGTIGTVVDLSYRIGVATVEWEKGSIAYKRWGAPVTDLELVEEKE